MPSWRVSRLPREGIALEGRLFVIGLVVSSLLLLAPGASGQLAEHTFQLPADGTIVRAPLAPGTYLVTASGTYDYDTEREGDQLADAECGTDSAFWDDPVDLVRNEAPGVPVSDWHRHRYVVGVPEQGDRTPPFYNDPDPFRPEETLHFVDELDVGIGLTAEPGSGLETVPPLTIFEWEPAAPTAVNGEEEAGLGCDESNHLYATELVVPPGTATADFQIVDGNYTDNGGHLDLTVTGGPEG